MTPTRSLPPLCAADFRTPDNNRCCGSECSRWVPETRHPNHGGPALREPNEVDTILTGRGCCSDNLRAVPWADPVGVKS